eukprot:TRINITY_DN27084_c0_g1_i1.p1 TRINITY_DN27084_c0_g1~~TRINITY_DN27084_c0_g1_i1.p1  ORF type:complete len:204 (-),score=8.52 TRINITY_DN27084_c0_g1_i1:83-694(-)
MFTIAAFALLGVERFVYGYIFHFPESFTSVCHGLLRFRLDSHEGRLWQVAKDLGIVVKVFQFGVIGYDVLFRSGLTVAGPAQICIGLVFAGFGQLLNISVFNAIGSVGIYYGHQLGYDVPWCRDFPFNLGISDPQYWGVVLFIWGLYLVITPTGNIFSAHYVVPWLETFWYVASMKLLEHSQNGGIALRLFGMKRPVAACKTG